MEPKYIAVIDAGSSTIKGAVAAVDPSGGINVLAVEEAPAADAVRYGRVQNAREISARADEIVRRLENNPAVAPACITTVFVANGGRSLCSAASTGEVQQTADTEVTAVTVERLHKEARFNLGTDRDVLAIAPKRYFVDNVETKTPVGAFGERVRGEFTFITASPENQRNLQRVKLTSHGREIGKEYITRLLAQTGMALTDSDRQLGCLYIDFGAETTTLAVYRDGALEMAAALPMGSRNISRDLSAGLGITEDNAETLKLERGQAVNERANIDAPDAETREIINYVSARVGEIVANVVNAVTHAGIKTDDLKSGIVMSGGGSRLTGLAATLEAQTRMKVRRAAVDRSIRAQSPDIRVAEIFDLIALIKYAADRSTVSCLQAPDPVIAGLEAEPADVADTPAAQPVRTDLAGMRPGRRAPVDEESLLADDDGMDDPLPEPGATPEETRRSLLERLKNWIAPKVDDLDEEEDE